MRFSSPLTTTLLAAALTTHLAAGYTTTTVCEEGGRYYEPPCEDNVESPEVNLTPSPSLGPSASPTEEPSFAPTHSSSAPTYSSSAPTRSSSEPTVSPTPAPTPGPSASPSVTASSTPSNLPSGSPTNAICSSTAGVYGDIDGDETDVEYAYELETTVSEVEIKDNVLPELERAITDSILPELFADECRFPPVRRSLRVKRRLSEVVGVSRNPDDSILGDVTCESSQPGNTCVVVGGILRVYTMDGAANETMRSGVVDSIKNNMNNGYFDDAQHDIVRVTYTQLTPEVNPGNADETQGKSPQVNSRNNSVRVGIFVAGAFVVAILVALAYRRRQKTLADEGTEIGSQSQATSAQ